MNLRLAANVGSGLAAVVLAAGGAMGQAVEGFDPAAFQKQMEAMQKAMETAAKSTAPVVDHRELKALLPESLGAFKRTSSKSGKQGAMGMTVVNAEGEYEGKDKARLSVEITDTAGVGAFGAMAQMGLAGQEIDNESDDGYERTVTVNGFKAIETYSTRDKNGDIKVLLGRFIVEIRGRAIEPAALRAAAEAIDLKKLSTLKGAGK